jgi:hypothetical protein
MFKTMMRAAVAAGLFCVMPFAAAQTTYSVFVDTDGSSTSGCDVTYPGGVVRGAEVRFDIPVTLGVAPQVGQVRQSACGGGSFVPGPLIGSPYVAGTNNGLFGSDVLEMQTVVTALPGLASASLRLSVAAEGGGASDVLLTRTGAPDGGPIGLSFPAMAIPTLGALGLILLGGVVLLAGLRQGRKRLRVVLAGGLLMVSGVALATSFVVDGQVNDWAGATPLATDPAGDPTNGSVALDLRALFGAIDGGMLTVRVDVADLQNRPPVANAQAVTLLEDAAATTITLTGTDPEAAALTFILGTAPTRGTLGPLTPTGPTSATVTYTPNANANGADNFTFRVNDGVLTSPDATVAITITPVNDAPSFTASTPPTINEDAGTQTLANWASFNPGPPDEATQTATYTVSAISNTALFSTAPAVAPNGTLSYTPAANANGTSTFTVTVRDSGGTANGGVDTSPPQTFTITVNAINDAPSFTAGPNQTIDEDAGAQTINPWATAISAGPPDEAAQTVTFNVTGNTNAALFSAAPAVSATGVLTYTPAANANGSASITLTLSDSGPGAPPPNANTSPAQTLTFTVNAVNDAPVNTVPGAQTTGDTIPLVFSTANANAISVADVDAGTGLVQMTFATGAAANGTLSLANPGGGLATLTGNGTASVVATGTITALNTALNGPAGGLTYTPVAGTAAARTITVTTNDQGNTGSGGPLVDTDTITVNVDAPPVVTSTPANGATIAENAAITVNFSEPVNVIAGITFTCTGGSVSGLAGTTGTGVSSLNLTYSGLLGGTCTLTVPAASVSDVDTIDPPNNPVADYVAAFTVDAAPAVTATTPVNGATTANNVALQISFSEPVNATNAVTLSCGAPSVLITITGGASGTAVSVLNPTFAAPLPAGPCTLTVLAANVTDADLIDPPNNLPANVVVNFTVDAAPLFVSSIPAANGAVVGTGQTVSFTFDENVANLGGAITLDCGGNVAGTISGGGTPTLTFTSTNPLTAGASCTATAVAAQIGDSDAFDPPQNPAANVVRTFSVDAAPTITGVVPANGATDVGLASNLVVSFSEPVNFAAGAFTLACPNSSPVAFTISGSGTDTATIDPTPATLPINTLCRFTVDMTQVTDVDSADPPDAGTGTTTVDFTTVNDNPPSVTASTPAPGATTANNVALGITFNEPINATAGSVTLTCGGPNLITGGTTGSNVTSLTPTYTAPLPSGACTLTVLAANITDFDLIDPPDNMVANYVANFTVDAAPALVSSTPTASAVVSTAQTVSFTYNEAVTNVGGAITLICGDAIAGAISGSGTPTLTFTPTAPLTAGASCTATAVAAQINDADAFDPPQNPASNSTIAFTVDAAPAFVSSIPAANGAVVGTGQAVSFTFDEPVANLGGAITLDCGGAIAGAISGGGTPTLSFTPTNPLTAGASCTATAVAAQIGDSDSIDPPQNPVANVVRTFTVDAAPAVTTTVPANGAADVGIADNLIVNFSEAVTFTASAFTLNCPSGSPVAFTVSGSGTNQATVDPTPATLPINTLCVLTIDAAQIQDVDTADPPNVGTGITTVNFTTVNDSAPAVSTAEVEIGNVFTALPLGAGLGSDANTNIRLTFSEAVTVAGNWASLACGTSGIQSVASGLAVTDADPVYTLNPTTDLIAGESCTLTVFAAQVTDDDAIDPPNNMAANFVATFTVDAAPSVSSVVPANSATAVALNSTVSVTFSEPVTIGSAAAFSIECPGGSPIGYTVTTPATLPATATTFVLTPAANLAGATTCQFRVFAAQVNDGDNADPPDNMVADFTSSFTTVDTPPAVTGTTPANGATNVNPTSTISINFSEPVNFSTVANAANTSFDLECPTGTPADFSVVTASPAASVVLNPLDSAIAGRTCALTVRAAGITDADAIDPPDNMVADFTASFGFGAIATADSYQVTPHLTLTVPVSGTQGGGVLANDLIGGGSVTGFGFAPACTGTSPGSQLDAGATDGRLTLNADGSFAYQPPALVANTTRTFCYTVTGGLTANIAFNLQNTELVWFVDAAAAGSGTGTQARPFQDIAAVNAVDTANDTVYLAFNAGPPYATSGWTLLPGERVIGQASGSTLGAITGITPVLGSAFPALGGSAPTIDCLNATCITLGTGNTLRGFIVGDSGTGGTDIGGTNFGTLTVGELTLGGNGRALNLATGTLNGSFVDIDSSATSNQAININAVDGTWTVTNSVSVTSSSSASNTVDISNLPAAASITFGGGMTVAQTAIGSGIRLATNNAAASINLGAVAVTTNNGTGLLVNASPLTLTGSSSTVTAQGGPALDLDSSSLGTATLASASSTISATTGIRLNNITGTLTINGGAIATATNQSFLGTGTLGTTTYAGSLTKANAGKLVSITGAATGSVTLSGALTCTGTCTGIDVLNRGAGTIAFTNASKTLTTAANPGVTLDNNDAATINFSGGGLVINSTSGTGFNAINGAAAINVTGAGNTVTTTTGTAVNVSATTIGAGGMSFQSVTTTGATANVAINLANTGSGPFSVTGTGAAGSGGTIDNKTGDAIRLDTTGGLVTLNNMIIEDIGDMTGAIDTRSGHDAIQGLNVNGGLSLTGTTIRRISDQAIHGGVQGSPDTATVWNGLTLSGVTIENTNRYHVAGSGDANNEGTVRILGIRGTVNVTNSTFSLGAQPLDLEVTGGTLSLTATGNSFDRSYKEFNSGTRASIGNHCVDVRVLAGATANVTIGDRANAALANNFLNCRIGSIRIVNQPGAGANTDAIIARNNFRVNDHSSGIGGDFDFPMGGTLVWNLGSGSVDTIVENNLFELVTNASGGVGQLSLIAEGGPVQALVQNNTFDRPGNAPWWVQSRGVAASVMTARFVGNTVIRGAFPCTTDPACGGGYFAPGLRALADAQQGATLNFTMENNLMARHDTGFDPGQTIEVRALNTGAGPTVCSRFLNNQSPDGYSLEQLGGTVRTVAAAGSCAAGNPSPTCQSVFQANSNLGGLGVATTNPPFVNAFGTVTVNNTVCAVPSGGPF